MLKKCYLGKYRGEFWPTADQIAPYFLDCPPWIFPGRNDSWGLEIRGLEGTENVASRNQVVVNFHICGRWNYGNYLVYSRWDGPVGKRSYLVSKGDLSRRLQFVETGHGDLLSAGCFIPFESGWRAVKEFIKSDGRLPRAIEWINGDDLPPDTFFNLGDRERLQQVTKAGDILSYEEP